MPEISINLVFNFFIFLSFPFFFGALAKKLKLSPILGYIVGGVILGNLYPALTANEGIMNFAYFGIILLLFTLGLEVNLVRLLTARKFIITGGIIQLTATIVAITLISLFFGFSGLESFLIGIALASSSTTLVAKIIQDRGEENSFVGEMAMGILIFQDIAFIPFLIIFTSLSHKSFDLFSTTIGVMIGLLKSTIIIAGLFYLGSKIIPKVFNFIAKTSRELLNLFIILFIFFITALSLFLQIPILIGVFVAGVLVAQTLEHYHIFSQVRPMRDLLAVIFFVFIGANIKLSLILGAAPAILLFTSLIILIKAAIILLTFIILRFHSKTAFVLSTFLFQIDEYAFILMSMAYASGIFSQEKYLFIIAAVLLTLLLTPIAIKNREKTYNFIRGFIKKFLPFLENFIAHRIDRDISPIDELSIKNHVVICGYGRVGSYIGRSLMLANIPFVAIDYNFQVVEKAKKEGVNIIYGDPSDIDILDYAQVDEAAMLILAVPENFAQETIILNAQKLNPEIYIIGRAHRDQDSRRLRDVGAQLVVQPEFEASISIIKKIYLMHKLSKNDIIDKIKRLKLEHGFL